MSHIKSLNFGYLSNINKEEKLDYINAMATFISKEALLCSNVQRTLLSLEIMSRPNNFQLKDNTI